MAAPRLRCRYGLSQAFSSAKGPCLTRRQSGLSAPNRAAYHTTLRDDGTLVRAPADHSAAIPGQQLEDEQGEQAKALFTGVERAFHRNH